MQSNISPRQQEVLDLLNRGLTVKEIALELGVTRNAIYLQIQKLRQRGALAPGFTATGRSPRELRQPGQDALLRLLSDQSGETGDAGTLALVEIIRRARDELDELSQSLSAVLPR